MTINTIIRQKQGTPQKRLPLEQKRSSGIITPLLKMSEKVIDLYHSTKSVMQAISQSTLKINI